MRNDFDGIFFIKKPPTVTFEDGMFHICFEIGKSASIDLVMSPANFLKTRKISARVLDQFHEADTGKVKAIRKH